MTIEQDLSLYAVAKGRQCGVFIDWGLCHGQVNEFSGNLYQKFPDISNCVKYLLANSAMSRSDIRVYIDDTTNGIPLKDFRQEMISSYWESKDAVDMTNEGVSDMPPPSDKESDIYVHVVLNSVLAYVVNSVSNSAIMDIKKCCLDFYDGEELVQAKNLLWQIGDQSILKPKINRRSCEKVMDDILDGITGLEAANKLPRIAVDPLGLNRIPKIKPAEILSVSICERVTLLEHKLQRTESELSNNLARVITLEEKVNRPGSYAERVASGSLAAEDAPIGRTGPKQYDSQLTPTAPPATDASVMITSGSTNRQRMIAPNRQKATAPPCDMTSDISHNAARTQPRMTHLNELRHGISTISLASNASSKPSGYDEGYRYQGNRHKKTRPKPITGTRTTLTGGFRGAPAPSRDIFVYRVEKDTPCSVIKDYMVDHGTDIRSIECVSNENSTYSSFKLEVSVTDVSKVLDPEFWPIGVCARRFYMSRESKMTGFGNNHTQP